MDETPEPFKVAMLSLWATILAKHVVDGHEKYADSFNKLLEAPQAGNLFDADSAALAWLKKRIDATVGAYFQHFTELGRCSWRIEGRLVARRFKEFQPLGNSPGRYLSGIYFVSAPKKARDLRLRDDVVSN